MAIFVAGMVSHLIQPGMQHACDCTQGASTAGIPTSILTIHLLTTSPHCLTILLSALPVALKH